MSFRSFAMITVSLLVSLPTLMAQAEEKPSHHKANRGPASISALQPRQHEHPEHRELNRIYQTLMKDSQKQLSPSVDEHSVWLPNRSFSIAQRSLASEQNRLPILTSTHAFSSPAQHAAIPWAADVSASSGVFSVK